MLYQKKILIIGAGILQVPAIIKAKEMGLYVIAQDMDPNAPGLKLADEGILISTIDIDKSVESAVELNLDAVMTIASDMPIRTVAAIGERLSLNTVSTNTAINATDKGKMREQLKKRNVPIPRFFIVSNFDDFLLATSNFSDKFIVKPADNSGSRGIHLTDKHSNLIEVFQYVQEHSRSGNILIEEYMKGPEVSVETLTINGISHVISITDKLTTGSPHFIEMGHSIPSLLSIDIQNEIINVATSGIKALGIDTGPSHTEIIITEEGPKVVEIGARLGGDNITSHLVPLATGIDIVEMSIRLALGENVSIPTIVNKGAAIRYFQTPKGILKEVMKMDEARCTNGVREITITQNIGERISNLNSSRDRIGYVIAQGSTTVDAINICERVCNTIKFNISDI